MGDWCILHNISTARFQTAIKFEIEFQIGIHLLTGTGVEMEAGLSCVQPGNSCLWYRLERDHLS